MKSKKETREQDEGIKGYNKKIMDKANSFILLFEPQLNCITLKEKIFFNQDRKGWMNINRCQDRKEFLRAYTKCYLSFHLSRTHAYFVKSEGDLGWVLCVEGCS